jgi:CheY-like chemotaxis protein
MEQVILNLAVNARDAMPRGGKLAIDTGHAVWKRRCPHCGADVRPGPYVRVTVRDSGTGMDEFTRSHLFEPFFTTKAMDKGTGLGLATVEGIILQSGGHIDVESAPGLGTVFYIYLPAVKAQPETREAPAAAESARGTETILLVEDQPAVRQLAALFLQAYGYRAVQASGGEEALSHCAAQPIDLLLTDVVMPQMSGTELATRVRTLQPSVKVLFMSGHSEEVLAGHTNGRSRPPLIQKPFTLQALAAKVREVLEDRG